MTCPQREESQKLYFLLFEYSVVIEISKLPAARYIYLYTDTKIYTKSEEFFLPKLFLWKYYSSRRYQLARYAPSIRLIRYDGLSFPFFLSLSYLFQFDRRLTCASKHVSYQNRPNETNTESVLIPAATRARADPPPRYEIFMKNRVLSFSRLLATKKETSAPPPHESIKILPSSDTRFRDFWK